MAVRHPAAAPTDWPAGMVFTIGHSTLPVEEFIAVLRGYGVECLADIRTVPRSRHNPQFNGDALARSLSAAGIEYLPLPALGGLRHSRKDSPNGGWRNRSFRGYADYMQSAEFAAAVDALAARSSTQRIALMCAAAVPWRCHRSLVADALLVRGVPVQEIFSASSCRPHQITSFAKVDGTRVSYPPYGDDGDA